MSRYQPQRVGTVPSVRVYAVPCYEWRRILCRIICRARYGTLRYGTEGTGCLLALFAYDLPWLTSLASLCRSACSATRTLVWQGVRR